MEVGPTSSRAAPPRPGFLLALAGAVAAYLLAGEAEPPVPQSVSAAPPAPPPVVDTLGPGQTLSEVWAKNGFDPGELVAVVEAGREAISWRTLRPGTVYEFASGPDGRLHRIDVRVDRDRRLVIRRSGEGFEARLVETPFVRKRRQLAACIDDSPWRAVEQSGEDPALTVTMAEVLAAQIDFYTDLRSGDCFDALFTADERPDGSYRIVALEAVRFEQRSRSVEAYRFSVDGERFDYYDAEGRSLKRRFLRSPLKYTRITSGFGARRHPILRRVRAHDGVDYAAPVGTPVQASGDGVVDFAGRNGGYGLFVRIRHGRQYVTSYAHLSRIAAGVTRGAQVGQGDVIGYVGSTGLSTGPHLDYRFMKDGRYVDPLSTDLPTAEPLGGPELAAFLAHRDGVRSRLDTAGGRLATPGGAIPSGD